MATEGSDAGAAVSGRIWQASEALLRSLRGMGGRVGLRAGHDLFQQGDEADALYAVETGLLEVSTLSDQGRKLTHLVLQPGSIFGEVALFDGGPRTATVTALRESEVLRVPGTALMAGIERDPDLAIGLIRLMIDRMRWMSGQIEDQVFLSLEVRVCRRLDLLLRTIGRKGEIEMTQRDLADHVGATREAVSKVVNDLRKEGIIDLARGRIVARDAEALRRKIDLRLV